MDTAEMDEYRLFVLSYTMGSEKGCTASQLPPRDITHVHVADSATEIPNRIFRDCAKLRQVLFQRRHQASAFVIGERAFDTCILLQKVCIPSFVTVIGELAFGDCTSLAEVELSEGLKQLEGFTFYNCISLQETVVIPSTLKVMGPGIFENCVRLMRVQLPEGLQVIEYRTFLHCKSLQDVNIPSTVKRIGKMAFQNCESLRDVLLPLGLKRIEEAAFAECRALFGIWIPSTVDSIEYRAFENCHSLVTVEFPSGINAKFRTASFRGLHSLLNISLPSSMSPVKIVKGAFEDCTWLEEKFYHGSPSQRVPGRVDMREHERVVEGLCQRYRNLPLHEFCYDPPSSLVLSEGKRILPTVDSVLERECVRVDYFGLNPLHILACSTNLRLDVLELLLSLMDPLTAHKCCLQMDRRGNTCIDYLLMRPCRSKESASIKMIRILLQTTVSNRLLQWGKMSWHSKMSGLIDCIVDSNSEKRTRHIVNTVYQSLAIYERHETASLLELALWNNELSKSFRRKWDHLTLQDKHYPSFDRHSLRVRCGADVVIPHVTSFW